MNGEIIRKKGGWVVATGCNSCKAKIEVPSEGRGERDDPAIAEPGEGDGRRDGRCLSGTSPDSLLFWLGMCIHPGILFCEV